MKISKITFFGPYYILPTEQDKIAAELEKADYQGGFEDKGWRDELVERVRDQWQMRGYFEAKADLVEVRKLSQAPETTIASAIVHVEEGEQYRLKEITFSNINVFSPAELRAAFPMQPGQVFATEAVRNGLKALRALYVGKGYINFTPVPDASIDEKSRTIVLAIDADEGEQFRFGSVRFQSDDPTEARDVTAACTPNVAGQIYSSAVAEEIAGCVKRLGWAIESDDTDQHGNARANTVDLVFNLRAVKPCSAPDTERSHN